MSRDHLSTLDRGPRRLSGRPAVHYPGWLRFVCAMIAVVHLAKFSPLVELSRDRIHEQPELTRGASPELIVSALRGGVGVVVLFGGLLSCVVLYAFTRHLLRSQGRTDPAGEPARLSTRHRALVLALCVGLVLPDGWSGVVVVQPLVDPAFWVALVTSVVVVVWAAGAPRAAALGLLLATGGVLL